VTPIEQVRAFLADFMGSPDTSYMERRAQVAQFEAAFVMPDGVSAQSDTLGGIKVEWIVPDGAARTPVLFHLHGGGYVLGAPGGSRPFTTQFALLTGARVVSIDYRLAPEHPYPAAVDDAVSAYSALLAQGVPPGAIAVGGESAGGGLTFALLLAARDQGLPMPACAYAISPWTDLTCENQTFETKKDVDPLLTRRSLKEMGDAYIADGNPRAPYASPLFADLKGLPPLLIHVGSEEVLLDDARVLHSRARSAGVDSKLTIAPGMIHVWHMFHAMLPEGAAAIREIADFTTGRWKAARGN
jgi:phosphinothricin tripeptide acetyl hydrolase